MKRMRIKRIILVIALAVLIVALAVLPVIAKENAVHDGPQQSILRGVVETGNITTCLKGGGILMEETPENITVPDSVKLTGFLVANGDMVRPGDPIAQVDPVTVMAAIADTQQKLDLLATKIQGLSAENTATKLKANAGGIVKAVYAQKGQSVQDVILEHGCLAVLSLSGRMAVQVETENLILAGTGVNVIFENGTIIPAVVDSCLDGQLTVSFEDKNYEPGTQVLLQSEEGVILGSGVLVIRDPLRLMAAEGVVSRVAVSKGQRVDINDVLLELTDAGKSAEYGSLLAQRQEQEALLQTLITLHYTGVVTAPCDGVISGIKENCPALLHQKAQGEDDLPDSLSPELLTQLEQGGMEENTDVFIAAITPQQWVTVTIAVDEQDVLRLKPGMEAVVRIPALSEDIITATVTEISTEGKNQGGSSKFSVKLTLPHGEKMLAGMNVTVSIPVETVTNVNRIPVAAVVDLGSKTVVYRGYDADKETLTDLVEVVLGRSDGIYVEVISGLGAREVFYYGYYDTLELSDEPDFGVLPFACH
jgi:multidrug efflux pump subunit AcrA (membrane-fusion protein)